MTTIDRVPYSPKSKQLAYDLLPLMRSLVELPDDALRGVRFNSDDSVFVRLESQVTEEEFMIQPRSSLFEVLIDAARADSWYENEKDYDMDLPMGDDDEY